MSDPSTAELRRLLRDSEEDLGARSVALEAHEPKDVIAAALEEHGRGAIISSAFGAAGLCVLDLAQKKDPQVRAYTIDTGFLFRETTALMDRWVSERQLRLERLLPVLSPAEQAERYGDRLWERDPDACCAMRKVEPNHRALLGSTLWITALRRDEAPTRANTPLLERTKLSSGQPILKLSPLVRWTKKEVWSYIIEHKLPYNPLHDAGYPSIGCTHCTLPVAEGQDERAGRWAGQNKVECGLHLPAKN